MLEDVVVECVVDVVEAVELVLEDVVVECVVEAVELELVVVE